LPTRTLHTVAPGSATGSVLVSLEGTSARFECRNSVREGQQGLGVLKFEVAGKPYIFVGSDPNVTAANSYFGSDGAGGSPKPAGGAVSAISSDSHDAFHITQGNTPTIKVTTSDQSASNLDRTLTFTYTASGVGSVSRQSSVTARQFAYATNNSPSNQCSLGYGTDRTYVYTLFTHPDGTAVNGNDGLDGVPVAETFNPALQCDVIPGNGSIDNNGQFGDHVSSACSSTPLTCIQTTTQSISVTGYPVRSNRLQWTSAGVTYTSNGPTQ
jgi:hypothetical protein